MQISATIVGLADEQAAALVRECDGGRCQNEADDDRGRPIDVGVVQEMAEKDAGECDQQTE